MSTNTNSNNWWENFEGSLSHENNINNNMEQNPPTAFIDTISPKANPTRFDNLPTEILQITQLPDQSKTIPFLEQQPNMSLLTIATGFTNEVHQLHHFFESTTSNNDHASFALSGFRSTASILSLILSRLLNKTSANVPSIETLCDPDKISQILNAQYEPSDLETIEVSNSIILPPRFAFGLAQQNLTTTSETLAFAKDFIMEEDARLKQEWEASAQLDEDGSRDLANQPQWNHAGIKQYALLLQTLYHWNTLQSHRSTSFRLSDDETASKYLKALTEVFQPTTRTDSTRILQSSPPGGPNPFTDQLPPRPTATATATLPGTINPPNPYSTLTPEQSLACNALGLDPNTYAVLSAMQPQNQQTNQGQAMALNRLAGALDKFSDATAASISDKQKLPKVLIQAILNGMTQDGESPATELTQTMKDIMQGSEENTAALLEVILQMHNASATPTPRFTRAIKKGLWSHKPGFPDNCTVINLPQSLAGTPFENIDYAALKEEELRGRNMSEDERNAMYKNVITVSKTINYLLMKTKAFHAILFETYGEYAAPTQEAENWVAFLSQNLPTLMARQSNFDRDLPARLESLMSELFSEFFDRAKHGVPPLYLLDGDTQRQSLLRGHIKPDLSRAVEEALRPPSKEDRKRKQGDELQGPPNKRRNTLSDQVHSNQPNEFKMTSEKFHLVVQRAISKKQVNVPMCPSANSNECCKFIFFGKCNSNCPRSAAHTPIAGNRNRMENLRKFLLDCQAAYRSNKSPTDPDFD